MFDRFVLTEEMVDCRGELVAARGMVLSPEAIDEAARHARPLERRALEDTPLAECVTAALAEPTYRCLFSGEGVRDAVRRALLAVRLPGPLFDELREMRRTHPQLHAHSFATAAVAVRMLLAVGRGRALAEVAAAALLHDLGMRHVSPRVFARRERLGAEEALKVASHPLLGAYHIAAVLGPHPAVGAAHCHHWRCGQGYPGLRAQPSRAMEVVAVASAFAALTQPRPFRPSAYDARGAADVLVAEAAAGHADENTVKLLVHALRGGRGEPQNVRFARERAGHGPESNPYVHVTAPPRSPV